jgi:hypothetical protein
MRKTTPPYKKVVELQKTDNTSYYINMLSNTVYSMTEKIVFLKSPYEDTQTSMYAVYIYCELKYWEQLISHANYADSITLA